MPISSVACLAPAPRVHCFDGNGGPSLVADGGTLGPTGYYFGQNLGLSLSGTGVTDSK